MYCTNCGKEVRDGAKFCNHCGAELASPKPDRKRKGLITAILALICICALLGIGYYTGLFDRLHITDKNAETEQSNEVKTDEPAFNPPENALDSMAEIVRANLYHCYANDLDSWDASCSNKEEANKILSFYTNEALAVYGTTPMTGKDGIGGDYVIHGRDLINAGYALFYDFNGVLTDTDFLKMYNKEEETYAVRTGDIGGDGFELVLDHADKNMGGSVNAIYTVHFHFSPSVSYQVLLEPNQNVNTDMDENLQYYYRVKHITREKTKLADAAEFLGRPLSEVFGMFGRDYEPYGAEGGTLVYYQEPLGFGFGIAGENITDDAIVTMIDSYGGEASIYGGLNANMTLTEMRQIMGQVGVTIPEPILDYDVMEGRDLYSVSFSDPNNRYNFVVMWDETPETSVPEHLIVGLT